MLQVLENLYQQKDLNFSQAADSFEKLLRGKVTYEAMVAMLIALKTKGETNEEIAGAASALRSQALAFENCQYSLSDCCGTGGDGLNTINVSTLVSLVAATAGIKMVKHGNRSVSSKCGSADLIEQLGINIELTPSRSKKMLDDCNFAFLFAPQYHSGVQHVMPVRNSLKTRTIFNLIGPLANPAKPDVQLLGVYDPSYCRSFAEILDILGSKKALIVNGSGMDEIAIHAPTKAALLSDGIIKEMVIEPTKLGLAKYTLADIQVDSLEDNVDAGINVLKGIGPAAHIDMVAVNSGALLYLNQLADSIEQGYILAKEIILSGQVYQHVKKIKEYSNA